MDPITSGLTVLQLVQTIAQASALLLGYVASVRNADSSCRSLLNELSSIGGVLATVMDIEKDGSLPDNLRLALSNLMAEDGPVARLQMDLKKILPNKQERKKMKTMTRLTWPFKEKEAGAIADKLKQYCGEITNILAIDTWITLKEIDLGVQEVGRRVQEVGQGVQELKVMQEAHVKAEERQMFLQWMSPVACAEKHDISRRQRNTATGRWIFQAEQYKTWNSSNRAFLWLNGQPGSGKTILASAVIDEIQGGEQAEPQTLAYFYCNFRDEQTTIAAAVLRSLVVQLLRQSKDDWVTKVRKPERQESNAEVDFVSLRELGQRQRNGERCPTDLGFLRKLLVEVSTLVDRTVLVIDALDECKDYPDLVEHLVDLAEDARLRLFVTGRSEKDIQDAFHDLPTVSLKDSAEQMQEDICVHITEQLKTQERLSRLSETIKTAILEALLEKAKGMFRWVQCQLDVIMKCKRPGSILKALDDLPEGLYETYDRIIRSIEERGQDDGPITQRCLLLLAGAFRPLRLSQLNEAMMIEVGKSSLNPDLGVIDAMDIVVACGSLVTHDETTGVVALSHYSVKEYLISRRPINILTSISDMHARICELLITYILCDSIHEVCAKATDFTAGSAHVSGGRKDHPLLSYAVIALTHLHHVEDEDSCVMAVLRRLHFEFLHNTEKHSLLESLLQPLTDGGQSSVVTSMFKRLRRPLTNRGQSSVISPSLLFIPLRFGNPWMVETLVQEQRDLLDVDVACGFRSPLIFAISSNPVFLSVLLKLGVDLPDDILHTAIMSTQRSPEIINKLCQRGAKVTFIVEGSTPLHTLLSQFGPKTDTKQWLPVVKTLVGDLSVQDWTARTVLHIALDNHLSDIVAYLLEQNAQLTATATIDPNGWGWAKHERWFIKLGTAALVAGKPSRRIRGKIIDATAESPLVEFPGAVTVDHKDPNPICAVVVSVIHSRQPSMGLFHRLAGHQMMYSLMVRLSRGIVLRVPGFILKRRFTSSLKHRLSWLHGDRKICSRLFDYHQGNEVTCMLRKLTQEKDSAAGDSLFLETTFPKNVELNDLDYTLDIYRGPLR